MQKNKDISILKIINYNLLFFIPLLLLYVISYFFASYLSPILHVSKIIAVDILMIILSLVLFMILIPMLRTRESVKGVRLSLFLFIVTGFLITVPSLFSGNTGILLSSLLILGNFVFATFIMSPDVIGISGDLEDWLKHKAQIMIFTIYVSIILLYMFGFAWMYFSIAHDPAYPNAFSYTNVEQLGYPTFVYYSVVTMATVGYGDISPVSSGARLVMTMQTIIGMIINVVFIAILMMYVSTMAAREDKKNERKIAKEENLLKKEERIIEREEHEIKDVKREIDQIANPQIRATIGSPVSNQYDSSRYPNYMNGLKQNTDNNYYRR